MDRELTIGPAGGRVLPAAIAAAARRLADLVLPPRCLACGEATGAHDGLCARCWAGIDFIEPPLCDRLGIPLPFPLDLDGGKPTLSAAALADPPRYDRARAVARHSDVMRRLVHDLKYRDRHEGLALYARWLTRAGAPLVAEADLIVPVPLHATRLWRRRFNQSALLARRLARATGLACDARVLVRTRRTRAQVGLTRDQRRRNLAGAIALRAGKRAAVEGRAVLLIDDVITTGATAEACAGALRRAGAARVDVLALARVVDPLAARQ